jgi:hypothetical protein
MPPERDRERKPDQTAAEDDDVETLHAPSLPAIRLHGDRLVLIVDNGRWP